MALRPFICEECVMLRRLPALVLLAATVLLCAAAVSAQNLVVSNARIIVGPGQTIERGAIVVTNGRISAVNAGAAPATPPGATVIDGTGLTVMAGFIDDHRHIVQGRGQGGAAQFLKEQAPTRMRELLEAG